MTRGSRSAQIGAIAAALILAACSGGSGSSPSPLVPTATLLAMPQATKGEVGSIVLAYVGTPAMGSPGKYALTITAKSASGAVIDGTYAKPISLTNSDESGATRLSRTSVPNSGTVVSLIYNGKAGSTLGGFQGAMITAKSGRASGQVAFLANGSNCVTLRNIGGFYPCDLQNAYSLPSATDGKGQTVAIVDAFDNPKAEDDLDVYRSEFGLPPCTTANHCFKKVNQRGLQGRPPVIDTSGWSLEASLDVDMVSAICPNCHIILVEADSDSFADLGPSVDEAAKLGATQISNSYGTPEAAAEKAIDHFYHHPQVTIVASSGDSDYGVSFPANSPYVTAAGGTTLSVDSGARGWNETVWNNEDVQGAGSGCSAYEPKPVWQKDSGCPNNRMDTDVAAVGDPYTGVAIYDTYIVAGKTLGGWETLGGTSVAAPIIASVYALGGAGNASLDYASSLYSHAQALNDVTNGNNGTCTIPYFCTARPGYDGPTGNGTPNGVGAFGGAPMKPAQSSRTNRGWRHVAQAAPGTPVVRACSNPKPGFFACDAIVVPLL
jgi:subtilase family serine protease